MKIFYCKNFIKPKIQNNFSKYIFKTFTTADTTTTQENKVNTKIKYKFNIGVVKIPHFEKKHKGGEDAYAVHDGMICVADGVGGWNEIGVDPSKYSNELCGNLKDIYLKNWNSSNAIAKKLFVEACEKTKAIGSATFCMCVLDLEKEYLHGVHLGDSGYMLIRGKNKEVKNPNKALRSIINKSDNNSDTFEIIYKTEEQQHSFNFPFQVGTNGDNPEDAQVFVHKIQEHDIIVLGTDGLWDNLNEHQILKVIKPFYELSTQLTDMTTVVEMIGKTCEKYSLDQRYKSPFSVRSGGLYLGGKPDDITIVLAQVVKNELL